MATRITSWAKYSYFSSLCRAVQVRSFHTTSCVFKNGRRNKKTNAAVSQVFNNEGITAGKQPRVLCEDRGGAGGVDSRHRAGGNSQAGGDGCADGDVYTEFRRLVDERIAQGDRSVLVRFNKRDNIDHVLAVAQKSFSNINYGVHFKGKMDERLLLLELSERYRANMAGRVISLKELTEMAAASTSTESSVNLSSYEPRLLHKDQLNSCDTISDQMAHLYATVRLSEEVMRCQYFVCSLIIDALRKMREFQSKQHVRVLPFGSAASDIAMDGSSDLDLVVLLNRKEHTESQEDVTKRNLRKISKMMYKFPHVYTHVHAILHARTPIIKFIQKDTQIACDISYNQIAGLQMGEALHWLQQYESCFAPLVLTVKYWAKLRGVTRMGPGPWLSNFMLTMLVVALLQRESILPPLSDLQKNTGIPGSSPEDSLKKWQGTLLHHNSSVLKLADIFQQKNLEMLLLEFFEFYKDFRFDEHSIDVQSGRINMNLHRYAVCVMNPHDSGHNICKNVTKRQVNIFQAFCREAHELLIHNRTKGVTNMRKVAAKQQAQCDRDVDNERKEDMVEVARDWGLSSILIDSSSQKTMENSGTAVDIESLYKEEEYCDGYTVSEGDDIIEVIK